MDTLNHIDVSFIWQILKISKICAIYNKWQKIVAVDNSGKFPWQPLKSIKLAKNSGNS